MISGAQAEDFTAGKVVTEMDPGDRYPFVAGIVEGLAYSRFVSDGGETEGMGCIYHWFYEDEQTLPNIYQAFERFEDYLPGAVVAALAERACGE